MDTKDALKLKLVSKFEEWKADFDKLKAETKGAYAEGLLEGSADAEMEELESRMDETKALLDKLESSNKEKWEELKANAESQLDGFKHAFQEIRNKLSN